MIWLIKWGGYMNKETLKNSFVYLFIYVVLIGVYGFFQKLNVCTDMEGFECNFSEIKIIGFLTLSAYILTPLVALYIFISWKIEANYQLKINTVTKVNDLLRKISTILTRNHSLYNRIIQDKEIGIDYKYSINLEDNDNLRSYNNEILSLLKELYYLTNKDKNYILFREKYRCYVEDMCIFLKEIYEIKYESNSLTDTNLEITKYLKSSYSSSYITDLCDDHKTVLLMTHVLVLKKDLFNHAYNIQNDITNYILKNDFRLK